MLLFVKLCGHVPRPICAIDAVGIVTYRCEGATNAFHKQRATMFFMLGDYQASLTDIDQTLLRERRHFGAFDKPKVKYAAIHLGNDCHGNNCYQEEARFIKAAVMGEVTFKKGIYDSGLASRVGIVANACKVDSGGSGSSLIYGNNCNIVISAQHIFYI